jgi:hypothetical protein
MRRRGALTAARIGAPALVAWCAVAAAQPAPAPMPTPTPPPADAPATPPGNAPVTPPVDAPATPPADAPVTPPTSAPAPEPGPGAAPAPDEIGDQGIGSAIGLAGGGRSTAGGLRNTGHYLYQLAERDWFDGIASFTFGGGDAGCFRDRSDAVICQHGLAAGGSIELAAGVRRFFASQGQFRPFARPSGSRSCGSPPTTSPGSRSHCTSAPACARASRRRSLWSRSPMRRSA